LQATRPSESWLSSNRQALMYQIYSGAPEAQEISWAVKFSLLFNRALQPQYIAIMIAFFFVTSGAVGWQTSRDAKPGEAMYLAKRWSERAQLMVTFNDVEKAKLNLELASKRVAELQDVLNLPMSTMDNVTPAVAEIRESAKKQIQVARDNVSKLKSLQSGVTQAPAKANPLKANSEYLTADTNKTDDRIDINLPDEPDQLVVEPKSAETVIDEAATALDSNKLDEAAQKLEEVNNLIK